MGRQMEIGNPPIAVDLRHSARAKRLSLRVSRLDGKVTLTLPQRSSEREAKVFVESREGWLRGHLASVAPAERPHIGGAVRRAKFRDGALVVPDAPGQVAARVKGYLRVAARDALAEASDRYAAALDRGYTRLSLRDTRSRWGSCSSAGVLMYSWRLIMAPPDVLDYVAAHEVAHLVEINHSDAFWSVVGDLMPDYAVQRAWLRQHGDMLHRVQFTD